MSKRCLRCYQLLAKDEIDFHGKCSLRFFGTPTAPVLDLTKKAMQIMAKEIVIRSVAVTGVQPKLSLTIEKIPGDPKKSRITILGALGGNFILKPQSEQFTSLPENEDLTMHLASLFGIKTAEHALMRTSTGDLAYITKRFDRAGQEKLHCEDLCQLTETLTENKYKLSMEKTGKAIKQYATFPLLEAISFFEIALFCYFTGNADMHLKNFSIMRDKNGNYVITPCYDLLNTRLAVPKDKEEMALTINGKKSRILRKDFDAFGANIGLNEKQMGSVYEKFANALAEAKEFIRISFMDGEMKKKYAELLTSRAVILK